MKIGDVFDVYNITTIKGVKRTDIALNGYNIGNYIIIPLFIRTHRHKIKNIKRIGRIRITSLK